MTYTALLGVIDSFTLLLLRYSRVCHDGCASIGELKLLSTALTARGTHTFADERKILFACKQYGLSDAGEHAHLQLRLSVLQALGDTAADICQHHGETRLKEGQVQTAVNWFLQADDIDAVTRWVEASAGGCYGMWHVV
jgi:hypothetical protein